MNEFALIAFASHYKRQTIFKSGANLSINWIDFFVKHFYD